MDRGPRRALQLVVFDRTAQLVERTRLDLTHPLARDAEMLSGLREGARDPVVEAVADPQDLLLTLAERAQQPIQLLVLELQLHQAFHGCRRLAQVLGRELLERIKARA